MNIFYKHNNLKKHIIPSGLYQDLAFCSHNERIAYLQDAIDHNLKFAKCSKNAERARVNKEQLYETKRDSRVNVLTTKSPPP